MIRDGFEFPDPWWMKAGKRLGSIMLHVLGWLVALALFVLLWVAL